MTVPDAARKMMKKVEVLRDLEPVVHALMTEHDKKRELWMPHDLLGAPEGTDPEEFRRDLRQRAQGIPDACRAALALNTLTEEGLPHFHRIIAVYLGDDSHWRNWNNMWTAEEDRHGTVLSEYARDTGVVDQRKFEQLKFEYIKAGFNPEWDRDPYRVFVYTTLQERATQFSHGNTGRVIDEYEPLLGSILARIAMEEARHFTFYRKVFMEILKRDPSEALRSAVQVHAGDRHAGRHHSGIQGIRRRDPAVGDLRTARLPQDRAGPARPLEDRGARRARRVGAQGAGAPAGDSRTAAAHRRPDGDAVTLQDVCVRSGVRARIRRWNNPRCRTQLPMA